MTLPEFNLALSTIKLTDAQKRIAAKIQMGYRLILVNQHRADGGTYYWTKESEIGPGLSLEYAGRVHKAFWNISRALEAAGYDGDMKFALHPNNNVRYS